ncbi:MAG: AAA family ATPase [Holosporaceae bacterium]|jgi:predicted kinase|nr:AAA family ATPase [Holosporaceae bacterium]
MLIILSGLSGVGKTSIARALAKKLSAVYLRIDSIEQSLVDTKTVERQNLDDRGYRVAYSVASDNLKVGLTVISDSANPIELTRDTWRNVAIQANSPYVEIELVCSNKEEHKKRIETRKSDIPNLIEPTWSEVQNRTYEAWSREHIVIDTSKFSINESAAMIYSYIVNVRR